MRRERFFQQARLSGASLGLSILCVAGLAGCDGGSSASDGETSSDSGQEVDEAAVQALIDGFPAGFTQINDERDQTQAHTFSELVDVWVQDEWVDEYRKVDPDATGADVSMGFGATILKEQFNAAGEKEGFTVMVKGASGYNPSVGDWWWGFANAQGELTNTGVIDSCTGCHLARPDDDYLYGIPAANRR